jgi:pilus assembly protein Flp/PilA
VVSVLRKFIRNEQGATAIEYALIAGFISIAVVSGAQGIGLELNTVFTNVKAGFR